MTPEQVLKLLKKYHYKWTVAGKRSIFCWDEGETTHASWRVSYYEELGAIYVEYGSDNLVAVVNVFKRWGPFKCTDKQNPVLVEFSSIREDIELKAKTAKEKLLQDVLKRNGID